MPIVIGIDPSLTGTGIAHIDTDDQTTVETHTVSSKGKRDDDWYTRLTRIECLAGEIVHHAHHLHPDVPDDPAMDFTADLVVIEAPSLGQARQGGVLDRHGLWWAILARLTAAGVSYACVSPAARAKYATGKGNAGKDTVLLAVARRYPRVDVQDNNQADALVLATMGADHLGTPLTDLPKAHRDALAKVAWPAAQGAPGVGPTLMEASA